MNNIHVLSRGILIKDNHILLCKTKILENNFYFLPGGHIEHGESAKDTLLREFLEETGFNVSIKRFLGCLENRFPAGYTTLCHNHEYNMFFEINSENFPEVKEPLVQVEEGQDIVWMNLDDLNKIDLRPNYPLHNLIAEWLNLDLNDSFRSMKIEKV